MYGKNKYHTGHICYSLNEFDYVMISVVKYKKNRDAIKNCNLWSFFIISIKDLHDKKNNCCVSSINPNILINNIININDDLLYIFDKF
jgi:hypothetical protein